MTTTLIDPATITKSQAQRLVLDTLRRYPNRKNPYDSESEACLYTAQDNDDSGCPHCIIGQIAKDAGWVVPESHFVGGVAIAAYNYWPDLSGAAIRVFTQAQQVADEDGKKGLGWGTSANKLAHRWELVATCLVCDRDLCRDSEDADWKTNDEAGDYDCYPDRWSAERIGGHTANLEV